MGRKRDDEQSEDPAFLCDVFLTFASTEMFRRTYTIDNRDYRVVVVNGKVNNDNALKRDRGAEDENHLSCINCEVFSSIGPVFLEIIPSRSTASR